MSTYSEAQPFPHIVVDNFLHEDAANRLHDEFPSPQDEIWWKYDNVFEKKLASNLLQFMPHVFETTVNALNGYSMVKYLEELTGIERLITDVSLRGGGIHCILPGGKLDVHADFNFHPELKLDRRLNVLIYLNKDWREEYGGHLELWDKDMRTCQKRILPIFNRMVCFSTTDTAFHGHPDPVRCPDGMSRKSIALYYYSNGRPEAEKSQAHSTLYQRRPEDETNEEIEALRAKRAIGRLA